MISASDRWFSEFMSDLRSRGYTERELSPMARAYGMRESAWDSAERGEIERANAGRDKAEALYGYDAQKGSAGKEEG